MLAAGAGRGERDKAEAWVAQRLNGEHDFAPFVLEQPDLGVVSCAAGLCGQHAPATAQPQWDAGSRLQP
jgi:hypothetical protein